MTRSGLHAGAKYSMTFTNISERSADRARIEMSRDWKTASEARLG
jgi:hypothetical protein